MAEIRCPMCGKPNPEELDVCQYCEARLKPLTDELSRSQPPIHPGDEPTDRDTGELESALPQWLREVRQQARESTQEDNEQVQAEEEPSQPEKSADLLAGLQSQSEEDEEIPDWLSNLRGESPPPATEKKSDEDEDLSALRQMLGADTSDMDEGESGGLPDWISELGNEEEQTSQDDLSAMWDTNADNEEPAQPEISPSVSSSDFEWSADFEADSGSTAEPKNDSAPIDSDLPDWLKGDEGESSSDESGLPAWMSAEEPAPQEPAQPAAEGDVPDWLASLDAASAEPAPSEPEQQPPAEGDVPDWLASLDAGNGEATPSEPAQPIAEGDVPDWLASFDAGGSESASAPADEPQQPFQASAEEGELPDWLSAMGTESAETAPSEPAQPAFEGDLPDWLSSGEEESTGVEGSAQPPAFDETQEPASEEETPDWLASLGEQKPESEQPAQPTGTPAFKSDESVEEESGVTGSVFVNDEGAPISTDDVDAIFSMEMPDWLSDADSKGQAEGETPSTPAGEDLRPADLPEWVQAMRPVESVISETEGEEEVDQAMEESGPLAGLRGVLPAVPGIGPSSKPKAYSIKLTASEDQQSSAAMLEQMLASEINPKPITTQQVIHTQRVLRWLIAILLLLVVGASVFTGTQINPMPDSAPPETSAAIRYVQESLPADAPVLMVFDYEAALAGELEATAAPFVDHMLLLKHPRLSLISSNPVGVGLAERFMNSALPSHDYQEGQQLVNLGYLPGGAAGVLAFAGNPATTKPYALNGQNAWDTPALQGVRQLSDFAAIILLTNDMENARIWIEQTQAARGDARLLVISSAQSGPMILPYVQTGQVDGMITGLDGSAPIEQVNSGRPGMVRRYWDAYGLGLLAALVIILIGSLWSLISRWQARRKVQGEA